MRILGRATSDQHPAARDRGVMTKACGLAVRHGFVPLEDGGLGLSRVTTYAAVDNLASGHVIESVGSGSTDSSGAECATMRASSRT